MVFADKFETIQDPTPLLPILEKRWPNSCTALNLALSYKKYGNDLEVFLFGSGGEESDTWIIFKWYREDWNYWINISPPLHFPEDGSEQVFMATLISSGIIDWRKPFLFTPSPLKFLKLLQELCSEMKHCKVRPYPLNLFGMKPENALKLEVRPPDNVRVGPLEVTKGVPLIVDNWPYPVPNGRDKTRTVIRKCIENNVSAGVYVKHPDSGEEELVCGAVLVGNGQVSMLHTEPEHRRKGYGTLCLRYSFKELGRQGLPACLGGEIGNQAALNMYNSIDGLEMVKEEMAFISIEQRTNEV